MVVQEVDQARIWYLGAYPLVAFTGVVVTGTILGKLLGKRTVHVVAMGQTMMPQWGTSCGFLAEQPGQPLRHFRLTWLDTTLMAHPGPTREVEHGPDGEAPVAAPEGGGRGHGVGFGYEHVALGTE